MARSREASRARTRGKQTINKRRDCAFTGCHELRGGLSIYCSTHHHRRAHHGHPAAARTIPCADLRAFPPLLGTRLDDHETKRLMATLSKLQ